MATLTTSLKACPKRVINYQTYVKTGEKGEKACQRVDSQPQERSSCSNEPTSSNLYCHDYQQEKKITFALQNTSFNNMSLHFYWLIHYIAVCSFEHFLQ